MLQKFDTKTIHTMNIFENYTGVAVIDCLIEEEVVYIIVEKGKVGLAIGKNGNLIKRVEKVLGKNIKVFEYDENLVNFVKNLIPQAQEIVVKDKIVEVKVNKRDRGIVIGRNSKNLKIIKALLERNHGVKDVIIR